MKNKKTRLARPAVAGRSAIAAKASAPADDLRMRTYLACFLAAFACLLYANTIGHDYAYDDVGIIQQNRFIQQGIAGIPDLLRTSYWYGNGETNQGLYRPLSQITFAIEQELAPGNPHAGHFVNVALYGLTAFLLFGLLCRLLRGCSIYVPFIAALLFVAHPLHTEVVANIKSRDALLCFLFFILAARLLLSYDKSKKLSTLLLSALAYFLCVFSREEGLGFLAVFPLLLYFFTGAGWKKCLKPLCALGCSAGIFICLHQYIIATELAPKITYNYLDNSLLAAPEGAGRLATAVYMFGDYFRLIFFPHPLSCDYSFNQIPPTGFRDPQVLIVLFVFCVLAWIALRGIKTRSIYSFCMFYFAATMAMTSNIFFLIGVTMAERLLFAPLLGFTIAAAALLDRYCTGANSPIKNIRGFFANRAQLIFVVMILAGLMSAQTVMRNRCWENDLTLFANDVQVAPGSARIHYNYGTAVIRRLVLPEQDKSKKLEQLHVATAEFQTAVRIDPDYFEALKNLGASYYMDGNYAESILLSLRALEQKPGDPEVLSNLGSAYFSCNKFPEAVDALTKAIKGGFITDFTYNFLGRAYLSMEKYPAAIEAFEKALQRNPAQQETLNTMGSAYGALKEFDRAISCFRKSADLQPDNAQTWHFLGMAYQNKGDGDNASMYLLKAQQLGWQR